MIPALIHEGMSDEMDTLTKLVDEMRAAGVALAGAERDYKVGYAKARMKARAEVGPSGRPTPEKDADNIATVECADLLFSYTLAQTSIQTIREALRATESRLDALRSMGASVRGAGG